MDEQNDKTGEPAATAKLNITEAKSLASSYPADVEVIEGQGLLSASMNVIQCIGCGDVYTFNIAKEQIADPDEIATDDMVCPTCTKREGKPYVIPVSICVGLQNQVIDAGEKAMETATASGDETPPAAAPTTPAGEA